MIGWTPAARGRRRRTPPTHRPPPARTRGRARDLRVDVGDRRHLPADRPPAVEAQSVLRPLHGERHRPGVDRLTEAQHASGRQAGRRRRRSHVVIRRPSRSRRARTAGVGPVGDEHVDRPAGGAASVAAASAALPHEAIASGGRSDSAGPWHEPQQLGGAQVQAAGEQVTGLVTPGDVAGLVLDPHAAVGVNPSSSDSSSDRANGVTRNPEPSTSATASSSSRTSAVLASAVMPLASANAAHARSAS